MDERPSRQLTLERTSARRAREPWFSLWGYECWAAWLGLWHSPRYSLPALLSVALSVGAGTAVFSVFSARVLRPLPFAQEEELVQLSLEREDGSGRPNRVSAPFAEDFRALGSVFASVALQRAEWGYLTAGGEAKTFSMFGTSFDYFDTLRVQAEIGRVYTARGPQRDGTEGVVIRHGYWLSAFGGEPLIGKKLIVNGEPKVVLGILADDQALPSSADMWTPNPRSISQGGRFQSLALSAIARLVPGVSVEQAQARLRQLALESPLRDETGMLVMGRVTPLREGLVGAQRGSVTVMAAAVLAFALLACANFALLLATRASVRHREYAVRAALGANRWALVRQSAFEAAILVVIGAAVGLAGALGLIRLIVREYSALLANTPPRLDARVLAGLFVLLVVTAGAGTLVPALQTRRVQPMDALRAQARSSAGPRARRVRELLVAIQVALTLALLVNAGLLVRSIQSLLAIDPGFRSDGVTIAYVVTPADRPLDEGDAGWAIRVEDTKRKAHLLYEHLRELPDVQAVCVTTELPFDPIHESRFFTPEGGPERPAQLAHTHWVSPGCFAALGIPLLSGRDFTQNDGTLPIRAIVNRAFAKDVLGVQDAVGRRFQMLPSSQPQRRPQAPSVEVVGMVGDALEVDLAQGTAPAVYWPLFGQSSASGNKVAVALALAVRSAGAPDPILAALPETVGELLPNSAFSYVQPLQDWVDASFRERIALERVLVVFGVSALTLAMIGLFGVTAYTVTERSAEIGIRRALGASRGQILAMVLGETGAVVAVGILLGIGLSWLLRSFVESLLYGVTALDPFTHGAVCLGILVIASCAALLPARAAAAVSPSRALSRL
jgi:putative ABC transport system permease protein